MENKKTEQIIGLQILHFNVLWAGEYPKQIKAFSSLNLPTDIHVEVKHVDALSETELVKKYNVEETPTIIFLFNNLEITRTVGFKNCDYLQKKINTIVEDYKSGKLS